MEAKRRRDLQHIALPTAASTAYIRLTGNAPSARDALPLQHILDDVAHALALLAAIYALDPVVDAPRRLDAQLVSSGRFSHGGAVLEMPDGRAYANLSIQHADLEQAVSILRQARLFWKQHGEAA